MQCLQYKTDQQSDVKKVEKLNNLFFGLMANGVEAEPGGIYKKIKIIPLLCPKLVCASAPQSCL
jgi:hypothetical protein